MVIFGFNLIITEFSHQYFLNSKINIVMYAGFLSIRFILVLRIATKSLSRDFVCEAQRLVLITFVSLFTSLASVLFLEFFIVFSYMVLFINLSNVIPLYFCLYSVELDIYIFNHYDCFISNMWVIFVVLIQVRKQVPSFQNEA